MVTTHIVDPYKKFLLFLLICKYYYEIFEIFVCCRNDALIHWFLVWPDNLSGEIQQEGRKGELNKLQIHVCNNE